MGSAQKIIEFNKQALAQEVVEVSKPRQKDDSPAGYPCGREMIEDCLDE